MLQWMGGSRRKVTASRKSTQKRQKQFFEQRKRRQQEETASVERHIDDSVTYDHQQRNRSLDILSLLSVPKVAEECRRPVDNGSTSTVTDKAHARTLEDGDPTDHQIPMRSPIEVTREFMATDDIKSTGTKSRSTHEDGPVSSKSTWRIASKVRKTESDSWKIDSLIQPSILDIIGDDAPTNISGGKPVHEAHVAFSVEGLGDVGTETPKQSPQRPTRSCGGPSSNIKAKKKLHLCENLNNMLDDLDMEAEGPVCGHHFDSFPTSADVLSPFSYPEHMLPTIRAGKKVGGSPWEMNSLKEDRVCNFYNAGSSFYDEIGDTCKLNWKNGDTTSKSSFWGNVSSSFKFEDSQLSPRSQEIPTGGFNKLDEQDHLFQPMEEPKRFSFMDDYKLQAGRSSPFVEMGDERDNLISLSEESCSSSAVRGRNVADVPSERQIRRYGRDLHFRFKSNVKENLDDGMQDILAGATRQREECVRTRKFRRQSASHQSAYFSPNTPQKLQFEDSWQLDEGFPFSNTDSYSGAFVRSSENINRQERVPCGEKLQADLPHGSNHSFDILEGETSDFLPEPFNASYSVGAGYRGASPGVRHDFNIPVLSSKSSLVADHFGYMEAASPVPELSAQGSVTEEVGDKPKGNAEKLTPVSNGSLNTSQESRSIAEETNWKANESSFCKVDHVIHHEKIAYTSAEVAELTLDGELNTKELPGGATVLCQPQVKVALADVGCFMAKTLNDDTVKRFEAKTTLMEPSCQVMTVGRYVLQLFCVSKGKAPMWNAAKN